MISELENDPKVALKPVPAAVVIFYAPWCADCQRSEEYENSLANEFGNVTFYRFDAVNHEEIADIYKIERYPTYVFFKKGKMARGALVEPVELGEAKNWLEIHLSRNR